METAEEFIKRKEEQYKKGKKIKVKDIERQGHQYWIIDKWVFMKQSNYPEKVFVFERMKRAETEGSVFHTGVKGEVYYRIGYYIVGKIGNKKGRWTWGQYCPFIPKQDLKKILKLAKKRGVI